ncbi:Fibrocystin-L [Halocaridina rubra]|uniref:Fibrocystin-L n=1 Tax=Halocaridina rubra TaxID=373956 RepID=A0AAN9ADV1_HALRR
MNTKVSPVLVGINVMIILSLLLGSMTVDFHNAGTFYYAGDLVAGTVVMSGQIIVVSPAQDAHKVEVKLGGVEAEYDPTNSRVFNSRNSGGSCNAINNFLDGCSSSAPLAPGSDHLYFVTDICLTPVITAVSASAVESISGLKGMQVRAGVSLTINGIGFGNETCQNSVKIGSASCTVTSSTETSVTCDLDDIINIISLKAFPIQVIVNNRGTAAINVNNFMNEGQVTIVPVVTSFTPTMGSVAGGTLITISGSGLEAFDSQAYVQLGSGICAVASVSSAAITCTTVATPASTVTLAVYVSTFNIPAIADLAGSSYTFSDASTPSVTGISVSGNAITITGSSFGTDVSSVTVTLTVLSLRSAKMYDDKNEPKPIKKRTIKNQKEEELDKLQREEFEYEMHGYDEVAKESRSTRRPNILTDHFPEFDAVSDFWGVFTNSKAKTFEETKQLGVWKIAGSQPRPYTEPKLSNIPTVRTSRMGTTTTFECTVSAANSTTIVCNAASLPANNYAVSVNIAGVGYAKASGGSSISVTPSLMSMIPTEGSVNGGTLLTITGAGFSPGEVTVTVDGVNCPLESESTVTITCRVPAHSVGSVDVEVTSSGTSNIYPVQFMYSTTKTPVITFVNPNTGLSPGITLTLSGTNLYLSATDPTVIVGGAVCNVTAATSLSVTCTAPDVAGGSQNVVLRDPVYGDSNSDLTVSYNFSISAVTPSQGGYGGVLVVVSGLGFDPYGGSTVTVCGNACSLVSATSSAITCSAPASTASGSSQVCDVVVTNPDMSSAILANGFTYMQSLTPAVTAIFPVRGGTAGGTNLTITGTGFASSGNTVTIGGSPCIVTTESTTEIICVTEAHPGPGTFPVLVDVPSSGYATTDSNGEFFYIDRWSSIYTWGGLPVPTTGDLVVIEEGQTILLDQSTDVLRAIIIMGGHLVFDKEASTELVLRAEYILIVGGGSLTIGTEDEPFLNDAVIELHGNTRSIELPMYGAKVLAVRNGTLDLHGAYIPVTWTHLASTASVGSSTITLKQPVTWKAGDRIIIATTEHRFIENENEERTIASVSGDGLTLTLTEPLEFEHISIEQTLGGRVIETRAEVGLLTRNVKIRGNINSDFSEVIEACDETWKPDQFDTQSCFNGRYGEEIGSDRFGATVMLFGKYPDQDLVEGRIEYVEVTEAGQAFQLGRYPLHFHLVGRVNSSYIRGCAVHRTYNRAVTIHAANYLTIERNVVYNNMGHAIFTEDGVEEHNVIQYNLAVFTRTSSSLLNVDITPSSYWVVHPNNIVRHNAAAGGTHFGYWYRLESHPTGPSATNSICQNKAPMGQFFNNSAHSMGRYGLWVFSVEGYFPKVNGCSGNDLVAVWNDFTVWKCDRGAEAVVGGALQFNNFVALDNEAAGIEMVELSGGFGLDDGPAVSNSLMIGHSALSSGSCNDGASGIVAPKKEVFSISNTTFVNYDSGSCSALSGCAHCKPRQGGFRVQTKELTFVNAPNKLRFLWEHETIWIDADGTLSGAAENSVVPDMDILPPSMCQKNVAGLSVNPEVPGAVCTSLKFLRFNMEGPSISPSSLQARDLIVSNSYGNTSIPYRVKRLTTEGWMGILFTGETYKYTFDYSSQITNITYQSATRFMESGDYYYVQHQLMQKPDSFGTTSDERNSSLSIPDPVTGYHGDYYWNNDTQVMTYLVSENTKPSRRTLFETRPTGRKREINFRVYRCYFTDCIQPTPPPVPTGRPDVTFRWSDVETWKEVPVGSGGHPTDSVYGLPVDGDEIIIPQGMWLIVDTATPKLGRVYVYGAIEFEDVMDHTFEATIIYLQGGTVVAGFSENAPFVHKLNIVLRGSLDPSDPDNVDMPMPFGVPSVGWKAIGVFGQLTLHGQLSGNAWTKLGATAAAGDSTLTLSEAAPASWVNKEVMITATGKEASETEIRKVLAVSGSTVTLDAALNFEHLGETFTPSGSSTSYTMAGEVGLLTRNIVIEGSDYPDLQKDSFGGRIVVSKLSSDGVDYTGQIQLHSVELRNMGQEGFPDPDDPRYSLALVNLGLNDGSNYVKKCTFNKNYNTAIGLFGTDNITVEDNVIYHTVGPCIRDDSNDNTFKNNLLSVMLFPGTYNGREEKQNLDWFGAFSLNKAGRVTLVDNVVAGSEQAGFQTYGENCEDQTLWYNNEVHGSVFGVLLWKKSAGSSEHKCRRLNNFYAWRVWDTAFYMQHFYSFILKNVQAVDCLVGVNQLVYSPPALSHAFIDKTATTEDSVFVGASPFHTCAYQDSKATIQDFYSHILWNAGRFGGNSGIIFAVFLSQVNSKWNNTLGYFKCLCLICLFQNFSG